MNFEDKELKEKINNLKSRRKIIINEIKNLDAELLVLQKTYSKKEIEYYFERGLCSYCKSDLSVDDIKYNTVYCELCREADSVLDWNSKLT